jgi:molybdenum cofactor biosynthesis enzyme MoaA
MALSSPSLANDAGACLSPGDIRCRKPATQPLGRRMALNEARRQMRAAAQWTPSQLMGRRWPIGCVALEITQRCNLNCAACYLSQHSQAVKDLPLQEVFRRIDMIFEHYGANTDVQVTGGDPTLRRRDELIAIVSRIRQKGMRSSLFTNGIKATRNLLEDLASAGLVDVAFHVDMTQRRKGYDSELALNAIRQDYVQRARGLGLSVFFNTTVFGGNFDQIPDVTQFFIHNSDVVRLASFQLQAETGRGELGRRSSAITPASVQHQIEAGAGTTLSFDTLQIGHAHCNRCAMTLVTNGKVYDLLDDKPLCEEILARTSELQIDRRNPGSVLRTFARGVLSDPHLAQRVTGSLLRRLWRMKADLIAARGRVSKLSFFIHNFMDACELEGDRIDACVFMAATQHGPVSMCLHNAKRDEFILRAVNLGGRGADQFWDPLSGQLTTAEPTEAPGSHATSRTPANGRKERADHRCDQSRRGVTPSHDHDHGQSDPARYLLAALPPRNS